MKPPVDLEEAARLHRAQLDRDRAEAERRAKAKAKAAERKAKYRARKAADDARLAAAGGPSYAPESGAGSGNGRGNGHAEPPPPGDGPSRYVVSADWLTPEAGVQFNERGDTPLSNFHNALIGLRLDAAFENALAFDEMRYQPVLLRRIRALKGARTFPCPVEEHELLTALELLQTAGLTGLTKANARDAVYQASQDRRIHPLRDWLTGLRWDGTPRLDYWLHWYLGADDSDYVRVIGRCFLIAMIARVMQPGCKVDYMLVLEGPQGIGKSTAIRVLAGEDEYFAELPNLHEQHVRVSMSLRGRWLIEVSELASFSRSTSELLKSFLTRDVEKYVPLHGHSVVTEPRQNVLVGTTNKTAYLRDETGGRRFWPVRCVVIDLDALKQDREQLLAEAMYAYGQGERWWPNSEFEAAHIQPVQASRYDGDAWEQPIARWLDGFKPRRPDEDDPDYGQPDIRLHPARTRVTLLEVARSAMGIQAERLERRQQLAVAGVMRTLGWEATERDKHGQYWTKVR